MKSENRVTAVSFFYAEMGQSHRPGVCLFARIAREQCFFLIIQERGCIMMKLFF